jgi:DNA-binding NtrC family response regulator
MSVSHERPARVLVVDDRPEMSEMIAEDLSQRGYEGVAVSSGATAIRMLRTERVDALVTDLRMPEVDGLTLLRTSRSLDPSRPVILMTAYPGVEGVLEATELGVLHTIMKPFRLDVLARLVAEALRPR